MPWSKEKVNRYLNKETGFQLFPYDNADDQLTEARIMLHAGRILLVNCGYDVIGIKTDSQDPSAFIVEKLHNLPGPASRFNRPAINRMSRTATTTPLTKDGAIQGLLLLPSLSGRSLYGYPPHDKLPFFEDDKAMLVDLCGVIRPIDLDSQPGLLVRMPYTSEEVWALGSIASVWARVVEIEPA